MKRRNSWILASALALLAVGCASDAVVFATHTVVGVDIQAAEAGSQGVKVGYSRQEFVSMPVRDVPVAETTVDPATGEAVTSKPGAVLQEAYPVLSISSLDTGALFSTKVTELHVRQVFATGAAATQPGSAALVGGSFAGLVGASLLAPEAKELMVVLLGLVNDAPSEKEAAVLAVINRVFNDERGLDLASYKHFVKRLYTGTQQTEMIEDAEANAAADALTEKEVALLMIEWAAQTKQTDLLQKAIDDIRAIPQAPGNGE